MTTSLFVTFSNLTKDGLCFDWNTRLVIIPGGLIRAGIEVLGGSAWLIRFSSKLERTAVRFLRFILDNYSLPK